MNTTARRPQSARFFCVVFAAAAAALLAACAAPADNVYFITKTSTSIVDADTVPGGVSIGYQRVEGYAGPRYADGSVFPVASSIESKGQGWSREVRQAFAIGHAAVLVTRQDDKASAAENPAVQKNAGNDAPKKADAPATNADRKAVFFGTTTSVGMALGFVATGPVPNAFTLGYKRKELAVIPVDQHLQNTSVLGSFTNTNGVSDAAPSPAGAASAAAASRPGLRLEVQQYFATGLAAEQLAALPSIRQQFRENAVEAMGSVAKFREQEASQGRVALDALACAEKLMPDGLERVLANAQALDMFPKLGGVAAIRAAPDDVARRQKYVTYMTLLDPANALAGQRLQLHKTTLCGWANAKK
jgi:hypothetical protein